MRKFIIPDMQFVKSDTIRYLTDEHFCSVIAKNNEMWFAYHDVEKMALVVCCENKPRNLLVYGLKWEEAT